MPIEIENKAVFDELAQQRNTALDALAIQTAAAKSAEIIIQTLQQELAAIKNKKPSRNAKHP